MERAAEQLQETDTPQDQQLAQNANKDSDPEVRARNIAMLWLYHRDSPALLDALAATLSEQEFRTHEPLSPAQHRLMLSLLEATPERVGLDKQAAAAVVLGKWGTVEAVPVLRAWIEARRASKGWMNTQHWDSDFLKRTALQSVAAIQERVGEVDGGRLSIADATTGSLSQAQPTELGALSVAEEEGLRKRKTASATKLKQG